MATEPFEHPCGEAACCKPDDTCKNLTTRVVDSGHWMAQEKPVEVNAALGHWLATQVPDIWPIP